MAVKKRSILGTGVTALCAAAVIGTLAGCGAGAPFPDAEGAGQEAVQADGTQAVSLSDKEKEEQEFAENSETEGQEEQMYLQNPITSVEEDTWYDYGTGDPYVMRYNGNYYLYMSTRDTEVGVKCFRSRDLVNWSYEGLCTQEVLTKAAYAPEVVYYNGRFYMYTSPAGQGHYVLCSDSPTGPFTIISDNLGLSIDGSVFIDDDGKWYFYHAGDSGIVGHEMSAPNEMNVAGIDVRAYMDGWTEGPMVIKHDGRYFLTYTGNHVFSDGYRINYGVGESPRRFAEASNNPILLSSLGDVRGIGHSSSVKGPDLDSYYIVYHSLIGRAVEGMPKREMNVDRIVFNGDRMEVLGPTTTQQQMPDMPDLYAYFSGTDMPEGWESKGARAEDGALRLEKGGYFLSVEGLQDQFSAEYNLSSEDGEGRFGGYFCYTDKKNYGCFVPDAKKQTVTVELVVKNKKETLEFPLPSSFGEPADLSVNQAFQVEKKDGEFLLYFNDRLLGSFTSELSGGKVGYFAENCGALCGFIGASSVSGGLSACTYEKPVPGTIQGIHYSACSDSVQKVWAQAADGESSMSLLGAGTENSAEYLVNVEKDGVYDLSVLYASEHETECFVYEDGTPLTEQGIVLPVTEGGEGYRTAIVRGLSLRQGVHTIRLEVHGAGTAISEFTFRENEAVEPMLLSYDSILDDYIYFDGKWRIREGQLVMEDAAQSVGKRLYGSEGWGDYSAEADIEFTGDDMDAGLIFRASNPALGGGGDDPVLGTWFFQGYYAGIRKGQLVLGKVNYNWKELESVSMEFEPGRVYHLCVSARGGELRVLVDGTEYIVYEDDTPFISGAAGIRSWRSQIRVDNFEVKPR